MAGALHYATMKVPPGTIVEITELCQASKQRRAVMRANTPALSAVDWSTIEQALRVAAGSYRETVQIHGGHMSDGPTQLLRQEADRCRALAQKLVAATALKQ